MNRQGAWIETDSYDRIAFSSLCCSPALQELAAAGEVLIPQFEAFLQDLFAMLFKYNVIFLEETPGHGAAEFQRWFLKSIAGTKALEALREQTVLDEVKSGIGAVALGQVAIGLLRSETVLSRREMLQTWEMQKLERDQVDWQAQRKEIERALSEASLSSNAKDKLARVIKALNEEERKAQWSLKGKARQLRQSLAAVSPEASKRIQLKALEATRGMLDLNHDLEEWYHTFPEPDRSLPRKLEIGKRLAENQKLKRLVLMVGRLRDEARAARRKVPERASEEIHDVTQGNDLSRLVPSELALLRNRALKKEFSRRFSDQKLLQYEIKGEREQGKGPLVVCVDVSSSMSGEKEIWAKAIALTLMDIARKQKRMFRTICFSSHDQELLSLNSAPLEPVQAFAQRTLDLAQYFPGGGTDFQSPLEAAVVCLKESEFRRGDVVMITDGQADVTAEWEGEFLKRKRELDFFLYSILIDLGSMSHHSLAKLSDKITAVSQLTDDAARGLFLHFS